MNTYLILLRGVNVGGKNKVLMAELKLRLEECGFEKVATYIASGNVVLATDKSARQVQAIIEDMLPKKFTLDTKLIKVLVLSLQQLKSIVDNRPKGFGDKPELFHSDAIFLMGVKSADVMFVFHPREGIDAVWPGEGVVYSQRLSELRVKSRLGKIIGTPEYQNMTIRSWRTTQALLKLLIAADAS